jgi:hypothetical protein
MLKVYSDETGIHDGADVIVLTGLIESEEYWSGFNVQWQSVLDDSRAEFFHYREFRKVANTKIGDPYFIGGLGQLPGKSEPIITTGLNPIVMHLNQKYESAILTIFIAAGTIILGGCKGTVNDSILLREQTNTVTIMAPNASFFTASNQTAITITNPISVTITNTPLHVKENVSLVATGFALPISTNRIEVTALVVSSNAYGCDPNWHGRGDNSPTDNCNIKCKLLDILDHHFTEIIGILTAVISFITGRRFGKMKGDSWTWQGWFEELFSGKDSLRAIRDGASRLFSFIFSRNGSLYAIGFLSLALVVSSLAVQIHAQAGGKVESGDVQYLAAGEKVPAGKIYIEPNPTHDNLWSAILAGTAGVLGASLTALFSYLISARNLRSEERRLRASVVTTERLRWLQDIRQRLTHFYVQLDNQYSYLKRPIGDKALYQKDLDVMSTQINEQCNLISLMLNPHKEQQGVLKESLYQFSQIIGTMLSWRRLQVTSCT